MVIQQPIIRAGYVEGRYNTTHSSLSSIRQSSTKTTTTVAAIMCQDSLKNRRNGGGGSGGGNGKTDSLKQSLVGNSHQDVTTPLLPNGIGGSGGSTMQQLQSINDSSPSKRMMGDRCISAYNSNNMKFRETMVFLFVTFPLTLWFSLEFPHMLSKTASLYYIPTNYVYTEGMTYFDNSPWTYITDYIITIIMMYGTISMYQLSQTFHRRIIVNNVDDDAPTTTTATTTTGGGGGGAGQQHHPYNHLYKCSLSTFFMLLSYAISVICGGLGHHFFVTLDMMNTTEFRILWTTVVSMVALASGFIGYNGTCLGRYFDEQEQEVQQQLQHSTMTTTTTTTKKDKNNRNKWDVPILPGYFWFLWGSGMTVVVIMGGMSFYRPACDIFIAGTTQFAATAYSCAVVVSRLVGRGRDDDDDDSIASAPAATATATAITDEKSTTTTMSTNSSSTDDAQQAQAQPKQKQSIFHKVRNVYTMTFVVAFMGNAPLLPMYPELLYWGLDLGVVNTILHCWLAVTWTTQYWALWQINASQLMLDTHHQGRTKKR